MHIVLISVAVLALAGEHCHAAFLFPSKTAPMAFPNKPGSNFTGQDWALLIAGSGGWGNYRHQADVCHAYQVLSHGGLDDDHIVVMMADDLASNYMNPHPGKVFNKPGGHDVYKGVPLDYTGPNVNAETFLAVLEGDEHSAAILGTSGKVIKSGPKDRVFVYFADHGAPGILGMPFGPFLYADQLHKTLRRKAASKGFADMVMYIEACESGSIFEGLLDESQSIYVTTAANSHESSWGTYCPGMKPSPPQEFTTCLGDLYSVAFLENCDEQDLDKETLEKQYELVRLRTSNNYTYMQGSHVMQFGSLNIDEEPASDYLGYKIHPSGNGADGGAAPPALQESVPQRDADLLHLWTVYTRAPAAGGAKAKALQAFQAEVDRRATVDLAVRAAVGNLLSNATVMEMIQATYRNTNLLLPNLAVDNNANAAASAIEMFTTSALPRAAGTPLVDDWDCLRGMMNAWIATPGCTHLMDQYGMQYSRAFANLCNAGVSIAMMQNALQPVCSPQSSAMSDLAGSSIRAERPILSVS
ncbi:hypothetical protein WJX73_004252 [Symbiochloris irregularis]|uniref:legumain n=1 Tax=Symbiochloris irregularis TaxID=706552 RepID=A0AAW1NQM5_9CHLO